MNLKNNKAPGPDNIGPKLIKFVAGEICNPIQYIYNLSFEQGIIPDKLKLAKVIPVFKSGDPTLPSNYRPISLLDIFDKLLEKLMVTRLCRFLQQNNILYEYLVPSIYFNYFVLNNEIHNYNTRLSQGLHICGPRTSFGQKCIKAHFGINYHYD